jgi:predicted transcriptional regulator with HTH domain
MVEASLCPDAQCIEAWFNEGLLYYYQGSNRKLNIGHLHLKRSNGVKVYRLFGTLRYPVEQLIQRRTAHSSGQYKNKSV